MKVLVFAFCLMVDFVVIGQPYPTKVSIDTNSAFNKVTRILTPAHNVITNIVINWNPYTNAWFAVSNSTDLTNWSLYTTVPVWQTSLVVPMNHPEMFYKVATIYTP